MEAMQDKLIREKLNSLDSLPVGYAPSLDSKWELLSAGKPEKQRTPLYFWYAAAASLLLLLGFGLTFWQTEKNAPEPALAQQKISVEKAAPKLQKAYKPELQTSVIKPVIASSNSAQKNGIAKPQKTIISEQKTAIFSTDAAEKPAIATQTAEDTPALIAAENTKTTSKKKNRYVELDFDAPETPQRLPQPAQTAQLQFKIRLLPQASESDRTTAQGQNPLRLQHTF